MRRKQNIVLLVSKKKTGDKLTVHFSETIKLQFGKERHTLLCLLRLFTVIVDKLSFKKLNCEISAVQKPQG